MEITFRTEQELYDYLSLVLQSKVKEFNIVGLKIDSDTIWKILKNKKWKESYNLSLSEMVNDIFKLTIEEVQDFIKLTK